ncbi:MAG: lmo0937 family membrane protein [Candidatus Doudnabacteria bacterium]|nr:lmo0937 family membrane protein [Candidatus Doudnabacteria bacterium]
MLLVIALILCFLWVIGMLAGVGGYYIHLLLGIATAILIFNIIKTSRTRPQ